MLKWFASLAVGSSRRARPPFTLNSNDWLSLVPRNCALGAVPALPVSDHPSEEPGAPWGPAGPAGPASPLGPWAPTAPNNPIEAIKFHAGSILGNAPELPDTAM